MDGDVVMLRVVNRNLRLVRLCNALDMHMEYAGWNEMTAHGDQVIRTNTPLPLAPSYGGEAGTDPNDRWLLDTPADNILWLQDGRPTRQLIRWLERRRKICGSRYGKDSTHRRKSFFSPSQALSGTPA
jgi:hypothetical protein